MYVRILWLKYLYNYLIGGAFGFFVGPGLPSVPWSSGLTMGKCCAGGGVGLGSLVRPTGAELGTDAAPEFNKSSASTGKAEPTPPEWEGSI